MPDVIHRNVWKRLGSYRRDIFAITAVLQWASAHTSMAYQWKSSYFGLYFVFALQNGLLNNRRPG